MRNALRIALILALLVFAAEALAHARIKPTGSIPPRSSNAGLKTGPCGSIARTATPTTLVPGSTITVEWEETVNHPGRFEFYFSAAGDTGWVLLKSVEDTQNTSAGLPHQYSTTLTLPNTPCASCTLQMIQVMTENPASPSLYYSCADIRLQSGAPLPPPPPPPPVDPDPCH